MGKRQRRMSKHSAREGDVVSLETHRDVRGSYVVGWHEHDCYELLYILRGSRKVFVEGLTTIARSGDLVTFRPFQRHSEKSATKKISYVVLRFTSKQLADLPIEFPDADMLPTVQRLPQQERVVGLLGRMMEEQQNPNEGSEVLLTGYLTEFLVLIRRAVTRARERATRPAADRKRRIQVSIEFMQDAKSRGAPLEALARKAFMSVSHFSHVFKEATGEPPKRYLIKERIERAKELLRSTDHSASEIAGILEYESPSFFYRQFKQKTGMTTSQFRQRSRRSAEK